MQSGIALWPGSTTRSARRDHLRIGADDDVALRRDVHERLRHRAQVAHPVVDDGDVGIGFRAVSGSGSRGGGRLSRAAQSVPLVDGIDAAPRADPARPPSRSARANALNTVSA